jgi:DNA adenine methylase
MRKNKLVAHFVKWVGGKRQLLTEINKHLPKISPTTTYYEPFIGGGAVLFDLQPQKVVINDFNQELINTYQVIKDNVEELINDLKKHENTAEYFYALREIDRDHDLFKTLTNVEKASRLLYLNKTCFNGLYRVNRAGEFNSPFGNYKNPNIVNEATLKAVSTYLNDATVKLKSGDYEKSLEGIKKNSFVYFDPPYDPVSISSNFTGYTNSGFNKEDQQRLKLVCDMLNNKGVKFLLSNSATPFILDLYQDYKIEIVKAKRNINSNAQLRGEIDEVLVKNYD